MKRVLLASIFSMCLGLLAASAWLLFNPVSAFAADGKANCGGFKTVSCSSGAVRCVCEDYVGCTSTFADGSQSVASCKSDDGPAMEESAY